MLEKEIEKLTETINQVLESAGITARVVDGTYDIAIGRATLNLDRKYTILYPQLISIQEKLRQRAGVRPGVVIIGGRR